MYTTISYGSTVVLRGYTEVKYTGSAGTYSVTVSDYGSYVFDHWGNGSTNRTRTQSLGSTDIATWTAYYRTGGSTSPPPATGLGALIPKTGAYFALYSFPDVNGQWQAVYNMKVAHPSVPFVCAFNPNSGPGSSQDPTFVSWINKLKSVGCIMIGYTFSKWGARPISNIESDAQKYKSWYNADGIFIDEFPTTDAYASYFTSVNTYCKTTLGMKLVMGNPGTNVQANLLKSIDVVNITEGAGYPSSTVLQWYKNWVAAGYDKRKLAMVRHTTPSLDTSLIRSYMPYCGLIEFTNGSDSNGRWFNYCSYWPTLVATLDV